MQAFSSSRNLSAVMSLTCFFIGILPASLASQCFFAVSLEFISIFSCHFFLYFTFSFLFLFSFVLELFLALSSSSVISQLAINLLGRPFSDFFILLIKFLNSDIYVCIFSLLFLYSPMFSWK